MNEGERMHSFSPILRGLMYSRVPRRQAGENHSPTWGERASFVLGSVLWAVTILLLQCHTLCFRANPFQREQKISSDMQKCSKAAICGKSEPCRLGVVIRRNRLRCCFSFNLFWTFDQGGVCTAARSQLIGSYWTSNNLSISADLGANCGWWLRCLSLPTRGKFQ